MQYGNVAPDWVADVARRQKRSRITGKALAERCGYSETYLSLVLSGTKDRPQAKEKILNALADMERELGTFETEGPEDGSTRKEQAPEDRSDADRN